MKTGDRVTYKENGYEVVKVNDNGTALLHPLFGSHSTRKAIEVPLLETIVSDRCRETHIPESNSWWF